MRTQLLVFASAALLVGYTSCGDDEAVGTDCEGTISRQAVLVESDRFITGALADASEAAGALSATVDSLANSPTVAWVFSARNALDRAREDFVDVAPYALVVDPAETSLPPVTTFPVDTSLINGYLASGDFDPTSATDFDRGLAAIEYLLHARSPEATAEAFATEPARASLLKAYAADVGDRLAATSQAWEAARAAYLDADGTAAGSGFSRLVNSISKHYEDTRRDRLGTPFGVTLGFPSPQALESPYAKRSHVLLHANIEASRGAFGFLQSPAPSLATYVDALPGDEASALATDIAEQYGIAQQALARIVSNDFANELENNRDAVQVAYNAISRQVVNLKTDLPSVTCVSITYVDNPSDSD